MSDEVAAIYRSHGGWVVAFLARRFGRQVAEDLAQETFLRLTRLPIDWSRPKAILARTALTVGLDHIRRENAQSRPRLVTGTTQSDGEAPADQHEALLHRQVVASLPLNLRDVYCLSRFVGLTYAEIAVHQGVSVKAVEKRMSKALKLCIARYRA